MNSDLFDLLWKYNFATLSAIGIILCTIIFLCKCNGKRSFKDIYEWKRPGLLGSCALLTVLTALIALDKRFPVPSGDGYHDYIIATLTIYGVILFALLISIIESGRSSGSQDTMRVLLWNSWIYPLSVTEIFLAITLLGGEYGAFTVLLLVLLGALLIRSVYQVINILIRKSLFLEKRTKLIASLLIEFSKKSKLGDEDAAKLLEEETASLRDDFERHIRSESLFFVREYISIYKELITYLLKTKHEIQFLHPPNPKRNPNKWKWFEKDLESIERVAALGRNSEVINKVAKLPIEIALNMAFKNKNEDLFEVCASIIARLREYPNRKEKSPAREIMEHASHDWNNDIINEIIKKTIWEDENSIQFTQKLIQLIFKIYETELLSTKDDCHEPQRTLDIIILLANRFYTDKQDVGTKKNSNSQKKCAFHQSLKQNIVTTLFSSSSNLLLRSKTTGTGCYNNVVKVLEDKRINPDLEMLTQAYKILVSENDNKGPDEASKHPELLSAFLRNYIIISIKTLSKYKETDLQEITKKINAETRKELSTIKKDIEPYLQYENHLEQRQKLLERETTDYKIEELLNGETLTNGSKNFQYILTEIS